MITYRIYTEDKNTVEIEALLDTHFDGYTVLNARGRWKGQSENSLVIEIIGDAVKYDTVKFVVKQIKKLNRQEKVLVTVSQIEGELL